MTPFDRAHFDHMTGGDAALQAEIIVLFRAQTQAWAQLLAADANWRDAAHTMKGSARGIGLWSLAAACEAAEQAGEDEGAGLAHALDKVRAALDEALAALEPSVAA